MSSWILMSAFTPDPDYEIPSLRSACSFRPTSVRHTVTTTAQIMQTAKSSCWCAIFLCSLCRSSEHQTDILRPLYFSVLQNCSLYMIELPCPAYSRHFSFGEANNELHSAANFSRKVRQESQVCKPFPECKKCIKEPPLAVPWILSQLMAKDPISLPIMVFLKLLLRTKAY
jgi:hypothetical protein